MASLRRAAALSWRDVQATGQELPGLRVVVDAEALGYGALFGLVVYGVYDFTNLSTLRDWPLIVAVVDVAWGMVASAICAAVVWTVAR